MYLLKSSERIGSCKDFDHGPIGSSEQNLRPSIMSAQSIEDHIDTRRNCYPGQRNNGNENCRAGLGDRNKGSCSSCLQFQLTLKVLNDHTATAVSPS